MNAFHFSGSVQADRSRGLQGRRSHIKECRKALSISLPQLKCTYFPLYTLSVFVSQWFHGSSQGLAHVICDCKSDASGSQLLILILISDSNCILCWPYPDSLLSQEQTHIFSFLSLGGLCDVVGTCGSQLGTHICTALTCGGVNTSNGTLKQWMM